MAPRILYLLDDFPGPYAGTEAQFWLLYRSIDHAAYRPKVVTLRPSPYLLEHVGPNKYECLNIGSMKDLATWRTALAFARRAKRDGFDVAHLFLNDVSVIFPPLLALVGIKVIVSRRDLGFWYSPSILRVLRVNRRFVARVVANCNAVKAAVIAAEGYPADVVEVILNGFEYPTAPIDASERRDVIRLGMLANLRPLKRVEDAIRAVAMLGPTVPCELLIGGEDRIEAGVSERGRLTKIATDLGVLDRVRFVGPVSNSWNFLKGIDIFLSCSETEGLSNSIIEAMASGLPVVGSAVGGTPELVEDGSSGYLYPVGSVEELSGAIRKLIVDQEKRSAFGARGRTVAESRLSVASLISTHAALYSMLSHQNG